MQFVLVLFCREKNSLLCSTAFHSINTQSCDRMTRNTRAYISPQPHIHILDLSDWKFKLDKSPSICRVFRFHSENCIFIEKQSLLAHSMAANYWQNAFVFINIGAHSWANNDNDSRENVVLICPFPFAIQICANERWTREWILLQHESHAYARFVWTTDRNIQTVCIDRWER